MGRKVHGRRLKSRESTRKSAGPGCLNEAQCGSGSPLGSVGNVLGANDRKLPRWSAIALLTAYKEEPKDGPFQGQHRLLRGPHKIINLIFDHH